jgi:hypothetical protein
MQSERVATGNRVNGNQVIGVSLGMGSFDFD